MGDDETSHFGPRQMPGRCSRQRGPGGVVHVAAVHARHAVNFQRLALQGGDGRHQRIGAQGTRDVARVVAAACRGAGDGATGAQDDDKAGGTLHFALSG